MNLVKSFNGVFSFESNLAGAVGAVLVVKNDFWWYSFKKSRNESSDEYSESRKAHTKVQKHFLDLLKVILGLVTMILGYPRVSYIIDRILVKAVPCICALLAQPILTPLAVCYVSKGLQKGE